MLSDYAGYIENIRNSLMQSGVIFPQIDNIESADYNTLFHVGEKLNDILYFYKIMVYSGNMERIFLPLDKTYRGTVRMDAFTEFKEDILPSLKEAFGDTDSDDNFNFSVLLDIDGVNEEEPEEWINEDLSAEDTIFDTKDLFGDEGIVEDTEEEGLLDTPDVEKQFVSSGVNLWEAIPDSEFVSSGFSLFSEPSVPEEPDWVPNGVELFSIHIASSQQDFEDVWIEEPEDAESQPAELWEDTEDVWVEEPDEVFEDSEEDDFGDEWPEEPEAEEYVDEDFEDEDIWVEEPEEVFEDSDEDVWVEEPDEVFEEVDVEDTWVEEPEDTFSDDYEDVWVEEPDEDSWSDDPEDTQEDGGIATNVSTTFGSSSTSSPKVSTPAQPLQSGDDEKDIVDSVQEAASAALTSAKRFLSRLTKS